MTGRTIVLGLDGADWNFLEPWLDAGELPELQRLMETGVSGPLETVVPPSTVPAWPCMFTGLNPGHLGIAHFMMPAHNDPHSIRTVDYDDFNAPALWDMVADNGGDSVVANIPGTYPPPTTPQVTVSGMMTPSKSDSYTHPDSYCENIKGLETPYHIDRTLWGDNEEFLEDIYEMTDSRFELFDELLGHELDLFFGVISATDRIQHKLWDTHELCEYWSYLDDKIGEFVADLDESDTLLIVSDHGFGECRGSLYVNYWLKEQGWFQATGENGSGGGNAVSNPILKVGLSRERIREMLYVLEIKDYIERLVPTRLQKIIPTKQEGETFDEALMKGHIDWDTTDCYALSPIGVYLEPDPGTERYRERREAVMEKFRHIDVPTEGVETHSWKPENLYNIEDVGDLPDVIIRVGNNEYKLSNRVDTGSPWGQPRLQKGNHRTSGIIVADGPNVESTTVEAHLLDIVPTVMAALGYPIPNAVDGSVLETITGSDKFDRRSYEQRDRDSEEEEMSGEVRDRLDDLGYLE
jgi:predicted AlkP superfamily phosphohydrolase/phosphomutase